MISAYDIVLIFVFYSFSCALLNLISLSIYSLSVFHFLSFSFTFSFSQRFFLVRTTGEGPSLLTSDKTGDIFNELTHFLKLETVDFECEKWILRCF